MALGTPVAAAAAYSAAAGATSVAPAYPTGIVATDALILFVGQKPTAANGGTVTTPAGWTLRDELTAAGGYGTTIGADTGNTNLRVYTKNTVAGTETGTLAVTLGGSDIAWAFIVRVPTNGGTLSYGSADGQRTTAPTANTPFAVALTNGATATAFASGDLALWAMCIPTDVTTPAQFSAQSITATGATFGAATEINEPDNTTGNDIGGYSAWASVTAGTSTVAPTVTVTAGGTVTNVRGPIVLLRVRETLPARTGTFSATESGPDGFDSKVKAPTLGAVAYSVATPTSISVPYPSGIAANDALVLFVAVKGTTEGLVSIPSAPSGWTEQRFLFAQGNYPSSIASLDAGNVQLGVYTKNVVSGSESGSVSVTLDVANIAWAIIARYPSAFQTKPAYISFASSQTGFASGDTSVPRVTNLSSSAIGSGIQAIAANDILLFLGAIPTSAYAPNLFSGHSFSPVSASFGSTKQIAEYATNTATHIGGFFAWSDVRSSSYLGDDYILISNVYIGDYASNVGGALAAVRIRQQPFFQGSLNATETGSDTFAGRPPRPDLGTRTGSLAATESPDRLTDLYGDAVNGYVTSPPVVGTIAYSTTTTISPAYPSGIAANSIIVMFVAQKPSTANGGTITTPAGWALQGQSLAGGGYGTTLGIDTGNQNIWVFTKTTVTGTETGTVAVTLGTTNTAWAAIASIQRSNSHPLSFLTYAGESTTPSTSFFAENYATVANPGDRIDSKVGDIVLFGASIASDNSTPSNFSNLNVSDSGGSSYYITASKLSEPDSSGGNDIGGLLGWTKNYVSSNPGAFTTFQINSDVVDTTNSAGPVVALRIRVEYPASTGDLAATEAADTFAGTGSATTSTNGTATVTGASASVAIATVAASGGALKSVTGTQASSSAASISGNGSATVSIAGQQSASNVASVSAAGNASTAVSGLQSTGSAATVSATGSASKSIVGVSSASQAASIAAQGNATATVTGIAGASQVSSIAANGNATVTVSGSQSASSVATITAIAGGSGAAIVTGQQAESTTGSVSGSGSAVVIVSGVSATSTAASVNAGGGSSTDANVGIPGAGVIVELGSVGATVTPVPAPSQGGGGGGGYSFSMDRAIDSKKKKIKPASDPVIITLNAIAKAKSVSARVSIQTISADGIVSIDAFAKTESVVVKAAGGRFSARGVQNLSDDDLILLLVA